MYLIILYLVAIQNYDIEKTVTKLQPKRFCLKSL